MSYISQIIVFALALMGTLFQSTKTDADGRTIYTKSGLPVLTTVGKVVVTLLVISFGISMLSVRQDDKAKTEAERNEKEAAAKLALLEEYNRGIKDTVSQVFAQNKELTEDQKRQFAAVLGEQERGGKELAGRIGASADLLQSRIENSSDILRGRIDSSIDVLNLTAGNIASLADPIRVINVNILILEVPLTNHPALEAYRNRLEAGIREFRAGSSAYGLSQGQLFGKLDVIFMRPDSPLLPRLGNERGSPGEQAVEAVLTEARLDILLYRTPLPAARLAATTPPEADLTVPVYTCMKRRRVGWRSGPCDVDSLPEFDDFSLAYDPKGRRAFLYIFNFQLDPPSAVARRDSGGAAAEWFKRPGGRINGSPDLAGSQVVIRVGPLYADLPAGIGNREEYEAIDRMRRQIRVAQMNLVVSDQIVLYYAPYQTVESRGGTVVIRPTQRGDERGFPFYFDTLPGTLEELLNPGQQRGR